MIPHLPRAIYALGLGEIDVVGANESAERDNIFIGDNPASDLARLTLGDIISGIDFRESNFKASSIICSRLIQERHCRAMLLADANWQVNYDVSQCQRLKMENRDKLPYSRPLSFARAEVPGDETRFFEIGRREQIS